MKSTYETIDGIVALLEDAQAATPTTPFVMPAVNIFDFCPGDFRFDGVENDDGVYIYFDETDYTQGETDEGSTGHQPDISIDIFMSKGATRAVSGVITYSPKACNDALKSLVVSIEQSINHAEFRRLLNAKITALTGSDSWDCSMFQVKKSTFIGTMRLKSSTKTIMVHKFTLGPKVEEIHGTDDGIPLDGYNDHIAPQRTADDDGTP